MQLRKRDARFYCQVFLRNRKNQFNCLANVEYQEKISIYLYATGRISQCIPFIFVKFLSNFLLHSRENKSEKLFKNFNK